MKNLLKKITLVFLLVGSVAAFGQSKKSYDSTIKNYLDELSGEDFSGGILVAKKDIIIEKRVYGLANKNYQIKNKLNTKFHIASISKMFTAVAILQLFQQGKIDLHQPIGQYLQEYPNKKLKESVTIHQLLTHTAGTGQHFDALLKTDKLRYRKVEDYLPLFVQDTLLFPSGSAYSYSNTGFIILALIIEKISGQPYYEYLAKNIFNPIGMANTIALDIDTIIENKAVGYTHFEANPMRMNSYFLSKADGASGYYSTIADLFKFSKALRNFQLLNKPITELMFEPKVKGYNTNIGYGIDIDLRYNQIIQGHSGGWYGVRGELMDFRTDEYTVIILSNIDGPSTTNVADFFKKLIAQKE